MTKTQVFLDKNKILFTYQSGFRKHYSTDTCLSYLKDKVEKVLRRDHFLV